MRRNAGRCGTTLALRLLLRWQDNRAKLDWVTSAAPHTHSLKMKAPTRKQTRTQASKLLSGTEESWGTQKRSEQATCLPPCVASSHAPKAATKPTYQPVYTISTFLDRPPSFTLRANKPAAVGRDGLEAESFCAYTLPLARHEEEDIAAQTSQTHQFPGVKHATQLHVRRLHWKSGSQSPGTTKTLTLPRRLLTPRDLLQRGWQLWAQPR